LSNQIAKARKIAGFRQVINQSLSFFKKSEPILDNRMKSRASGASMASRTDGLPTDACGKMSESFPQASQTRLGNSKISNRNSVVHERKPSSDEYNLPLQ